MEKIDISSLCYSNQNFNKIGNIKKYEQGKNKIKNKYNEKISTIYLKVGTKNNTIFLEDHNEFIPSGLKKSLVMKIICI